MRLPRLNYCRGLPHRLLGTNPPADAFIDFPNVWEHQTPARLDHSIASYSSHDSKPISFLMTLISLMCYQWLAE
jgi:hypothetical protein